MEEVLAMVAGLQPGGLCASLSEPGPIPEVGGVRTLPRDAEQEARR